MNKRELEFRKRLIDEMAGAWLPTIHVENHLNPGVPDLSYLVVPADHETGWLELKTIVWNSSKMKITVESGQHSWMAAHAHRIPAHFLIEAPPWVYLISGTYHWRLVTPFSHEDMVKMATVVRSDRLQSQLARVLAVLTYRNRP